MKANALSAAAPNAPLTPQSGAQLDRLNVNQRWFQGPMTGDAKHPPSTKR